MIEFEQLRLSILMLIEKYKEIRQLKKRLKELKKENKELSDLLSRHK